MRMFLSISFADPGQRAGTTSPPCAARWSKPVAGADVDGDLVDRGPRGDAQGGVTEGPLHRGAPLGVGLGAGEGVTAVPLSDVDEAQLGVVGQRLVHAGPDEPGLAGHDPDTVPPALQEPL